MGLVFTWFYDPSFGLLNVILGWVGLGPINVLGDPTYVTYGIIAAGLWPQTAYCMILYLTGLNAVDPEQIEAGRLDGARGFWMLWHVVLPQLRPATFIAFVVTIIGALRSFDLISIMTNGGPFGESRVLAFYMFEVALSEYGFRMGYGAAIAVVLFAIMLVYIAFFLAKMHRDEEGAVMGAGRRLLPGLPRGRERAVRRAAGRGVVRELRARPRRLEGRRQDVRRHGGAPIPASRSRRPTSRPRAC